MNSSKYDDEGDTSSSSSITSIENLRPLLYSYVESELFDRLRGVVSKKQKLYGQAVSTELKFWSAFATLAQGKYENSVHELEKVMRDSHQSYLPVLTALLYSHSRCELTDNQAVKSLTRAVMKAEKRADEDALLTTARFYMLLSPPQYDDAMKMVKSALKIDGKNLHALCTRGWIYLFQSELRSSNEEKKELLQSAARSFQPALKAKSLDSLLGLTRYFQIRKQFSKALEAINQVIVRHAWFTAALLTKARLLLSMSEWTDAKSTCERCLEEDKENVDALRILTLIQVMMVRIYISPGGIGTYLWDQQSFENNRGEAQEAQDVIESLMREPPMLPHTKHDEILLCYGKLMTRQKEDIDYVLRKCLKIIEVERHFVPALLCMSVALKMINQNGKARNQLKRICKIPYRRIYGREFEEAYLMLANIYMGTKKYDLALELCKRCLKYNKSCSKAWEHRGRIMEEEHSYKDAAEFYEKAWFYGQEASSTVGYKLAFNYLKAHRYIDAIDVCHKVLNKHPNYPKIRDEILDRARQALRS